MSDDNATLYGDKQIERLFQEINNTGATFTIIASPVPFTRLNTDDTFVNYKNQYDYFMYRLQLCKNNGLILVSGNPEEGTKLNQLDLFGDTERHKTIVSEFQISSLNNNNYSLISIKGAKGERMLSFETYNENGNLVYRKQFKEDEL